MLALKDIPGLAPIPLQAISLIRVIVPDNLFYYLFCQSIMT